MLINRKITLADFAQPSTDKLLGKRVWYYYESGETLEHHYLENNGIVWKGIEGTFKGYEQEDRYYAFEIAKDIYYIIWCEETTIATSEQDVQHEGAYPVCVVADFAKKIATAAYVNPDESGKDEFIIDQARLEMKE